MWSRLASSKICLIRAACPARAGDCSSAEPLFARRTRMFACLEGELRKSSGPGNFEATRIGCAKPWSVKMSFVVKLVCAPSDGSRAMPPSGEPFTLSTCRSRRMEPGLGVTGSRVVELRPLTIPYNIVK